MFSFQTIACLHDIPVIRSSTDLIQNVYTKAKDTSFLVRLPCTVAETVADKSLKIAVTVATPFVQPLSGSVRAIDDYAAKKIRQIEKKYPVITSTPDDVLDTFNEKTEPVRQAVNSVKDTATSTIQHGKETVSNVASATVNKANDVADSVRSYYGSRVQGKQRDVSSHAAQLREFLVATIGSFYNYVLQSTQLNVAWLRMLIIYNLMKVKQTNDMILSTARRVPLLNYLPERLLILFGTSLEHFAERIRPDDRTLAELRRTKQQSKLNEQPKFFVTRPRLANDPSLVSEPDVVHTELHVTAARRSEARVAPQPDYSSMTDAEELHARLAADAVHVTTNTNGVHSHEYHTESEVNPDVAALHQRIHATDIELLHSRVGDDIASLDDHDVLLTKDQADLVAAVNGLQSY